MNARERVLAALKGEGKPDRMPFEISWGAFTPRLMQCYHEKEKTEETPEEYFDFESVGKYRRNKEENRFYKILQRETSGQCDL